jgi:hypothetical protein
LSEKQEEKRKQIILRLPLELAEWLKNNVKGSVNEYLINVLKTHIESLNTSQQKEVEAKPKDLNEHLFELQTKLTPKIRELLQLRRKIMSSPDYANFKKDFEDMEYTYDPDNDAGKFYDPEKFSEEAKAYYKAVDELCKSHYAVPFEQRSPDDDFFMLFKVIRVEDDLARQRELVKTYGGLPSEVVWRDITRADVYHNFNKKQAYSIMFIASKLGLSYKDAYQHIVPWMRREGFTFEAER